MSSVKECKVMRFGKPSGPLLAQKASFFQENEALQANVKRICDVYAKQPQRTACKNCDRPLQGKSFTKLSVRYILCDTCGHLNGAHEDTDEFCRFVYTDNSGDNYAKTYSVADREAYFSRVAAIYSPKAEFLAEVLREVGEQPKRMGFADLGTGSGYFVAALMAMGFKNVAGYEVSETQLRLARNMIDGAQFHQHTLVEALEPVRRAKAQVVSLIGVLEHLQDPRGMLRAIQQNAYIKYVFISVPLFSFTTYLETIFPNTFHRQLGAGHTHLYTESSLTWIQQEFGLESIGEWWFGTDMVDLMRHVQVNLLANGETAPLTENWRSMMLPLIDDMQLQIDQRRQSSEVHLVLKKK